ncbi:MAG: hypothetical protein OK456_03605 [Thaumarchaeota archaeon]|nr:hypothetical protein [Nitrososphaerota archaeon]
MAIPKNLTVGLFSTILGFAIALANMFEWSSIQNSLGGTGAASMVLGFYAAQALSTGLVLLGLYAIYRFLAVPRTLAAGATTKSIVEVLGDALTSNRAFRIGSVAALLYGVLYAFFSSLVVYQPTVDFAQAYGATTTSWTYIVCCGDSGTVPKLIVYLSPSLHLGLQFVPLSLLFLFLVPVLVGFNVALSVYALGLASAPLTGKWLAASGAMVGLFTACPTCAGLFLASSVGGIGTTLAIGLAPYQILFVVVSIPVLVIGPLLTAFSVKRSFEASCRLPTASLPRNLLP